MIAAKKLAYADMIRFDADPRFAKIPVDGLRGDYSSTRMGAGQAVMRDGKSAKFGASDARKHRAAVMELDLARQHRFDGLLRISAASAGRSRSGCDHIPF